MCSPRFPSRHRGNKNKEHGSNPERPDGSDTLPAARSLVKQADFPIGFTFVEPLKTPLAAAAARNGVLQKAQLLTEDARGVIEKLAEGDFQSVLRITSKAGTVRANHYHKRDAHLCYLVRGKIEYVHRAALNDQATLERLVIEPGQLFYTPPLVAHAMRFLEDSEFYCFTASPRRTQGEYEDDVVRVPLVEPNTP